MQTKDTKGCEFMIVKNVHRGKLHQELVDSGIVVLNVDAIDKTDFGADITLESDVDMTLVQEIISKHTPVPPEEPLSYNERIKELEQIVNSLLLGELIK